MPRQQILNRGRALEGRTKRVSPKGAGFQPTALSLFKIPAVDLPLLGALCVVGALCALCALCAVGAVGVIACIAAPLVKFYDASHGFRGR